MRRSLRVQQDGDPVGPVEVPLSTILDRSHLESATAGRKP
jgi:hypothetical protein